MEFLPLRYWFKTLKAEQQRLIASNAPETHLAARHRTQKRLRETWHAAMFGHLYAQAFDLRYISLEPEPDEYAAHDATLSWVMGASAFKKRIQLKELPPTKLNATITIQQLLDSEAERAVQAGDVTIVVFLNRAGTVREIEIPDWNYSGYWFMGFSKPDRSELFLQGRDELGSARIFVPHVGGGYAPDGSEIVNA